MRLIINADDFGMSTNINREIIRLMSEKKITISNRDYPLKLIATTPYPWKISRQGLPSPFLGIFNFGFWILVVLHALSNAH